MAVRDFTHFLREVVLQHTGPIPEGSKTVVKALRAPPRKRRKCGDEEDELEKPPDDTEVSDYGPLPGGNRSVF